MNEGIEWMNNKLHQICLPTVLQWLFYAFHYNVDKCIIFTNSVEYFVGEGITGTVSIDENGDRNADYSLLDLNPDTQNFEVSLDIHLFCR